MLKTITSAKQWRSGRKRKRERDQKKTTSKWYWLPLRISTIFIGIRCHTLQFNISHKHISRVYNRLWWAWRVMLMLPLLLLLLLHAIVICAVRAHTYTCLWLIILGKSISQLARWLLIIILIVFWLIFGIIMWFRVATAVVITATEIPETEKLQQQ